MKVVVVLLLVLLGICHGVEVHCRSRPSTFDCSGPLGGSVLIKVRDDSNFNHFAVFRRCQSIIVWSNHAGITFNLIASKYAFTYSNGTFRINNLSWKDVASYTFRFLERTGKVSRRTLRLHAVEPLSSAPVTHDPGSHAGLPVNIYLPTIAGFLSALMILLVIAAVACTRRRAANKQDKKAASTEMTSVS